ncbi:Os02g0468100 [Oryza sativa Japonica Group]|uniref:Os02g0468100 protein n=2 Tax=Oryza sativa subsp. japonica TaxID=39947 RepID=A0A0P0VIT5_ORYSJ|nr:probable long-chain-alcohol O-fatty-acyltransferase 4 [Oryza sativa Japonica Group]BAS78598.1 Os02g0468100 [Oryza sativa Japonica Group]
MCVHALFLFRVCPAENLAPDYPSTEAPDTSTRHAVMRHAAAAAVPLATTVAMLYARLAASLTGPGPRRLAALLPAMALLPVLPLALPYYSYRGFSAFVFVWLGEFKLLLLAFGHGPLHPALRPLPFVFTAALPVKLVDAAAAAAGASASRPPPAAPAATFKFVVSSAIKVGAMAAIVRVLHAKEEMHRYAAFSLNAVFMYCFLDVVLPALGAAGVALGMEMEPQFDRPYLSASLRDFWGRRWNLVASAVLRAAVYDPVRARSGDPAAGVLAAFLVSGLMHEVVILYLTSRAPTGRVTAFFALHGVCVCAERWWCARQHKREARPQLPRAVAAPLVLGFVAGTAFWLFFPAIYGGGMDDLYLAEIAGFAKGLGLGGSWTGEN